MAIVSEVLSNIFFGQILLIRNTFIVLRNPGEGGTAAWDTIAINKKRNGKEGDNKREFHFNE